MKIHFLSVKETDWTIQMANEIVTNVWECEKCKDSFNITGMQRLRHIMGNLILRLVDHLSIARNFVFQNAKLLKNRQPPIPVK